MKKKFTIIIMFATLIALCFQMVPCSALSITDGDLANSTIRSTAPYDTLGFYRGSGTNHDIITYSFPNYITSDNTGNQTPIEWFTTIQGEQTSYLSQNYRIMDQIITDNNENLNIGNIDLMDLNTPDWVFDLYVGDSFQNATHGVSEIMYTLDLDVITIDFVMVGGDQIPYVYDNINEGNLYDPVISNQSKYQHWYTTYMGVEVSPYVAIQDALDSGRINTDQYNFLWVLLNLSTPQTITEGEPDRTIYYTTQNTSETDEAVYSTTTVIVDDQYRYDGNNYYIILFGEGKFLSHADMQNRGSFRFYTNTGERVVVDVRTVGKFDVLNNAINQDGQYVLTFDTVDFDITNTYVDEAIPTMPNLSNSFPQYFNQNRNYINIREIYTYVTIRNIDDDELYVEMNLIYDKTPAMSENWFISEMGGKTITFDINHVELPSGGFIEWLSDTVGGFFNTDIFGGVTIGAILWFVIGLGAFFAILKYFSGG